MYPGKLLVTRSGIAVSAASAILARAPSYALTLLWNRWLASAPIDELGRIEHIKGQGMPNTLTAPAVLSELAQHVQVHPAQRERAAPVAVDDVVQPQG